MEAQKDDSVEESIKLIGIMAGSTGRGSNRSTDTVMQMFINAHLLRGRKHCHRFHIKHYYRTADIRKSFTFKLGLSFC